MKSFVLNNLQFILNSRFNPLRSEDNTSSKETKVKPLTNLGNASACVWQMDKEA